MPCSGVDDQPGLRVWRVEELRPAEVSSEHHGTFFTGDCYLVLWTAEGSALSEIFFWLGIASSADDQGAAAIMANELDASFNGRAVLHRVVQAHETPSFCHAFSNRALMYREGSAGVGSTHEQPPSWPRLLHVEGVRTGRVTEHTASASEAVLHADEVWILDVGDALLQWNGDASHKRERGCALDVCRTLMKARSHSASFAQAVEHVVVHHGEPESAPAAARFWRALGMSDGAIGAVSSIPSAFVRPAQCSPSARKTLRETRWPSSAPLVSGASEIQLWRLGEVLGHGRRTLSVFSRMQVLTTATHPSPHRCSAMGGRSSPSLKCSAALSRARCSLRVTCTSSLYRRISGSGSGSAPRSTPRRAKRRCCTRSRSCTARGARPARRSRASLRALSPPSSPRASSTGTCR